MLHIGNLCLMAALQGISYLLAIAILPPEPDGGSKKEKEENK